MVVELIFRGPRELEEVTEGKIRDKKNDMLFLCKRFMTSKLLRMKIIKLSKQSIGLFSFQKEIINYLDN